VRGVVLERQGQPIATATIRLTDGRGAETIDVETGRVRPRAIVDVEGALPLRRTPAVDVFVRLWTHNLTNDTYAFNFGNPFSGTHFGARRRVGLSISFAWRHPTH
jgi:hypothetical protein